MNKLALNVIVGMLFFFASCATSMTPFEINRQLPSLTNSTFLSQLQADEGLKRNKCRYLTRNRKYVAPIGLTTKQDLKHGAKGIDEWVQLDGGNAYVLKNFKWVTVDEYGSTQLQITFDTMFCE